MKANKSSLGWGAWAVESQGDRTA